MNGKIICLSLFLFAGCGHAKSEPLPQTPGGEETAAYQAIQERINTKFLDKGMVVSKGWDQHKGDSLIWSGIVLGAEDCTHGSTISANLRELISQLSGGIARHWDLPDQVSLDGAIGLYWGIAHRIAKCPDDISNWAYSFKQHLAFIAAHNGAINNDGVSVPPEFDFAQQAIAAKLELGGSPSKEKLSALANEVSAWTEADKIFKAPCFRAHLSWLALDTAEVLGYNISTTDRNRFCEAQHGLGIPLLAHWCGETDLKDWISAFNYNTWEYQFQRCPAWELPDGAGYETPGVDLLIALQKEYRF